MAALGLIACAGTEGKRGAHRGKTLSIAPVDTAWVRVDSSALDDVLEVFPDDGGSLSGPRILPLHFQPRFRRQVERRLERAGLRLHVADTAPARPSPDFVLTLRSLRVHRGAGEVLVPKVGNLNVRPLYFTGDWELLESATGQVVKAGRLQMVVTTHRRPTTDEWRKAFDEAARQVMSQTPFRR